jgi:hypothetical protein
MHYILYCTKVHTAFKNKFRGYTPRASFRMEGKRGRDGKGKRVRAVEREVIGMEGKS